MGLCASKPSYIPSSNGSERDYQERFLESKTLGQGEFGIVKLVHDVKNKDLIGSKPLACKMLRKGFTFKDNTIYTPMKKHILQGEVEILRRLNGEHYNLKLVAVYESASMIYMVTEYCEGGEMMPWVSKAFSGSGGVKEGLRTEDVSRVAYQLWSAVNHCAVHGVIHRDIKPENVMFCNTAKDSQLRLIDFGSGTMDGLEAQLTSSARGEENNNTPNNTQSDPATASGSEVERHHTFAGSAFYISPEMFQRTYTSKTDVWSAGATLYVLVAGYPADKLQETFNVLQGQKAGRLRSLPNLPENMPESFYDMLEGALVYRHKGRMDASQLMSSEFSQFHIHHTKGGTSGGGGTISIHEIAAEAADNVPEMAFNGSGSLQRTTSVLLEGSVSRHNAYLGYQKFERSVTTLLATMLKPNTCKKLLSSLKELHQQQNNNKVAGAGGVERVDDSATTSTIASGSSDDKVAQHAIEVDAVRGVIDNAEKLQVVTIKVLLEVLSNVEVEDTREVPEVITMIQGQKNFLLYRGFAYHISLLRQFVSLHGRRNAGGDDDDGSEGGGISSVHGNNVWSTFKKKRGLGASGHGGGGSAGGDPDSSINSIKSMGGMMGMRRNYSSAALASHGG